MQKASTELPIRSHANDNRALAEKFSQWLEIQNYSPHTLKSYGGHLRRIALFLGGKSILDMQHADLLAFLESLYRRGFGKSTGAAYIYALRSFFRFLARIGIPHSSAPRLLQLPRLPYRLADFHSLPEIERLIAATRTPRERALIELAFATGCRISELRHIRVEDIDWQNRSIRVLGKGNKERRVFFGEHAERAARKLLQTRMEGFLFRSSQGRSNPHLSKCWYAGKVRWRSFWTEYDAITEKPTYRYAWFGNTKTVKRANAQRRLNRRLKGAILTRPGYGDHPLSLTRLGRIIRGIGKRAGLKTWPHKLRHSFATVMMNHGVGLREVQELLGHSSLMTTQRYLHTTTTELKGIHQQFHPREEHSNGKKKA
jgi:integrase/recombinase XerD